MAILATITSLAAQPAGSFILPNTDGQTDVFLLEGYASGAWSDIPADQYRLKGHDGVIVERYQDDSGALVTFEKDFTAWRWSGYIATPDGLATVIQEPLTFVQSTVSSPIDLDNAVDLSQAYKAVVSELFNGNGLRLNENGLESGNVLIRDALYLGGGNQTKRAHTAANVDNAGSVDPWTTPNNAKRRDGAYASVQIFPADPETDYLWLNNFQFKLPRGASILGITATVKNYHDFVDTETLNVQLVKNGSLYGSVKTISNGSSLSEVISTLGSSTDVWGGAWSVDDLNSANFGIALSVSGNSFAPINYVDDVTLTVYYRTVTGQILLSLIGNYLEGNILLSPDATYNIGADGATRPNNVYAAGLVRIGSGTLVGAAPTGEAFSVRTDPSGTGDHLANGLVVDWTGTNANSVQGVEQWITLNHASGDVGLVLPIIANVDLRGAGTVTEIRMNGATALTRALAGAVTNLYNYYSGGLTRVGGAGGTITNIWQFYAEVLPSSGVTNRWAFYAAGASDQNYFNGPVSLGAFDAMTYASTISLDVTKSNVHKTTTVNATGNATINASAAGTAGQIISVWIVNDATSGKTITWGTNFKPAVATFVGTTSKTAIFQFQSDGTNWYQCAKEITGL